MSDYHLLKINDVAQLAAAQVDEAKTKGTYEGNEKAWDTKVLGLMAPLAENAAAWTKNNADVATRIRKMCQGHIRDMDKFLKAKKFGVQHQKAIEDLAGRIVRDLKTLKDDNEDLASALVPQYRKDDWIKNARAAMNDAGPINKLQNARGTQIKDGAGTIQLTRRMEEYVTRAKAYIKEARSRVKDLGSMADSLKDIEELVGRMDADRQKISDDIYSCNNALDNIEQNKKAKKALDAPVMKMFRSYGAKIKATQKESRGRLKTMDVYFGSLKKRLKSVVGLAEMAKPQTKAAVAHMKTAQTEYKAFEKRSKEADKIMEKLEKLAK